eukprot:1375865-Amorphochlora_amoeboformis.AAC.1
MVDDASGEIAQQLPLSLTLHQPGPFPLKMILSRIASAELIWAGWSRSLDCDRVRSLSVTHVWASGSCGAVVSSGPSFCSSSLVSGVRGKM